MVEGGVPLTPEENEARNKRLAAAKAYKLRKKAEASGQDNQTVLMLLTVIDGLAMAALGPEAALLPFEREMIEGPVNRILGRLDQGAKDAVDKWADPVTLILGLAFWANRLAGLATEQKKLRERQAPALEFKAPAEPVPPAEPVKFVTQDESAVASPPPAISQMIGGDSINGHVGQGA